MKITFIGAGSFVFAKNLIIDLFSFQDLPDFELCLMDIDQERLQTTLVMGRKVARQRHSGAKISATTDRMEALTGADFVVAMYEPSGLELQRREMEVCINHGVPVARALRVFVPAEHRSPGPSRQRRAQ